MGKTLRKYRKSRTYDPVPSAETTSPYDIHDGKGTRHVDSDLLSSPREFVPLDKLAPGHASPLRVLLTMMTTSVGAMAVAMPYAILQGGFVMSIFMILFVGLVTHVTRTRLVELGVEQGIYSFQGLAKLAFGPIGGFVVAVTQLGVSVGLMIGYLLIVFQDIPIVLGHWLKMDFDQDGRPIVTPGARVSPLLTLLADHYWFPEALMVLVLLPYCLYATSYRLRVSPAFVCAAVLAAAFSAVVKAKTEHKANVASESQGYDRDYIHVPATVCQSFSIITMATASQHHSFHTFYAMRDRCPIKFKRLSLLATLGSLAFGLSIGIAGYISFLGATKGDVLHNYAFANNHFALIFWTALPLSALSCIGYEVIVSRHTMQFLCLPSVHKDDERTEVLFASQYVSKVPTGEHVVVHYDQEQVSWTSQLFTAMMLVVVAQVPIFYAQDVGVVLSLTGGLAGITMSFILPAACQLKLSSLNGWCSDHFVPCLSIVVGVVGALAAVISTAVHARDNGASSNATS